MTYKVCILAAGTGSRMGDFSRYLNKVLLPLHGKPTISHIIDYFPVEVEIVIAVGYLKDSLIAYLNAAYPNRKITYVTVDPYIGPGSGPGFSLLSCKNVLQCPFIMIAGDTLVGESIPRPEHNWIGVAPVQDTSRFCSVRESNGKATKIFDKVKVDDALAFIGLIGIKDYVLFWNALENNKETIKGEIQVSNGIQALLSTSLHTKEFTWFDTGTPIAYKYAIENYPNGRGYQGD